MSTILFVFICATCFGIDRSSQHTQSTGNDIRFEINSSDSALERQNDSTIINNALLINQNSSLRRIEVLAKRLKIQIDKFHDNEQSVELVFLVDASSSVGPVNFKNELNFVRMVLSDLNVFHVALITFASKAIIQVDQITGSINSNKCIILNSLKNISWTGGGTYTRGALGEALSILQKNRSDGQKVLFLITDGFSNGGDPRPIAQKLKGLGTLILTFGIQTGNVDELNDIASGSGQHSYFLDSFVEFESVARRALHRDLQPGTYVQVNNQFCRTLSNSSLNQGCDDAAHCHCTSSGQYACLCKPGYYGSGLQGSCHLCPNGTYGTSCQACPSPNHMTYKVPATSSKDCICPFGFTGGEFYCNAITCPMLQVPENGYLVQAHSCTNVLNAACGIRCRFGFKLAGDSIRLCLKNGTWSGMQTQCLLKTCPELKPPLHGRIHCSTDEYNESGLSINSSAFPIDAQCHFKCNPGYQLLGSKVRNCLPVSRWDGLDVSCKQIKCDPLPNLANGLISSEECTNSKKVTFGTNCTMECNPGFTLQGPAYRKCGSRGLWSRRRVSSRCVDDTPPKIACPPNATWFTLPGKPYSLPVWDVPSISEHSNEILQIWSKPAIIFPWKAKIGTHCITYIAEDVAGNRARCRFTIKIIDDEQPNIDGCEDPPVFLSTSVDANVSWDDPLFRDNSQKKLTIMKSHQQRSFFSIGTTQVTYNVTDESNNSASCIINITVQNVCNISTVLNGRKICSSSQCAFSCDAGYTFPFRSQYGTEESIVLHCDLSPSDMNVLPMLNCAPNEDPDTLKISNNIVFDSDDSACDNQATLQQLQSLFSSGLSGHLAEVCFNNGIDCQMTEINVICQANDSRRRRNTEEYHKRRRRKDKIVIKLEFVGKFVTKYQNNAQQGIKKLRKEIEKLTKLEKFYLLNEATHNEIRKLALNVRTIFSNVQGSCDAGKIFKQDKCVRCPSGTFANHQRHQCSPCSLGEYQESSVSESCKRCPQGFSTKTMYSTSFNDCIPVCTPGTYSQRRYHVHQNVSLMPCSACEIGFYQPFAGKRECLACPDNRTTLNRGSNAWNDCLLQEPCLADACFNSGKCVIETAGFSCECQTGFIGSRCEFIKNPCDSLPCINGGTCFLNSSSYQSYSCSCQPRFTGPNCEEYIDECSSSPCKHGTCVTNENDYHCNCYDGFTGEFCEDHHDLCSEVCEEGSTCIIVDDNWKCLCKPGYLGRRCQLRPCDWLPCTPDVLCVNLEEPNATHSSYRCGCSSHSEGFEGSCSFTLDYCTQSPCLNGGSCLNHATNYTCQCPRDLDGPNCQIELSLNFLLHFSKASISDYVILEGPNDNLSAFTICFWIQFHDTDNYGTVFSYATLKNDNTITLTDYNGLVLYINGKRIVTDVSCKDGFWHFHCVSWESSGSWFIYVDGVLRDAGTNFGVNETISGNGTVVLGQEQDSLGTEFSISEAFIGRLTLLDMWNFTLSEDLIRNYQESCEKYAGNIISWSSVQKGIRGDVIMEPNDFCSGCKALDPPAYGSINISNSSLAIYSCNLGYNLKIGRKLRTVMSRRCLKTGNWDGVAPKCVKVNCAHPGYFPRGRIRDSSFNFNDTVKYKCDNDHQLRGNPVRTCKANGKWSGKPPICIGITCKNLLAPEHGDIEYIVDEFERDDVTIVHVGQQLEFKCNLGFQLTGERVLTCLETGHWSHQPPSCYSLKCISNKNGSNDDSCKSITCGSPPNIPNAGKVGDEQEVQYKCHPGYRFFGKNSTKCLPIGKWSRIQGKCTKISCGKPEVHEDIALEGKSYLYGAILKYTCPGNNIKEFIICNGDGKWSALSNCKV